MRPEFVPIGKFSDFHKAGWKMIDGYPLYPGDYAVLMVPPDDEPRPKNNKAAGRISGTTSLLRNILSDDQSRNFMTINIDDANTSDESAA